MAATNGTILKLLINAPHWVAAPLFAFLFPISRNGTSQFRYSKSGLHLNTGFPVSRFSSKSQWVDELVGRNWVVHCKPPFGSAEQVVRYVGRYTHRVAISNRRLVSIDGGEVRFRYKEYKQGRLTWKEMTLQAEEFIQRFLWHVLPTGFHKIRHYGFLANGRSKTKLAWIREVRENKPESKEHHPSDEMEGVLCPICRIGRLVPAFIIDRLIFPC